MSFFKNIFGKKELTIASYADFWDWFQSNEKNFYKVVSENGDVQRDFLNVIAPKLDQIKEDIFYPTGMFDDTTAELILTPDGAIKNIVFIEELVSAAPNIEGWKFTALKPENDIKNVSVRMANHEFNGDNISFYANELVGFPDEIDLTIVHNDATSDNVKPIATGTYIFLDNYLGELNFITAIDNLTVIGKEEAKKELIPIDKLKDFLVWREKEFIEKYDGLRYHTDNDNYSMLEAELNNGNPLLAVINTDLLEWEAKGSHP